MDFDRGSSLLFKSSSQMIGSKDLTSVGQSLNGNDLIQILCIAFALAMKPPFHINSSVNRRNSFTYSHKNPHAVSVQPMRSPSILYWSMVSPKLGVIFHIATTTTNGERYKDVLTTHVVPLLKQRRNRNLFSARWRSSALFID